MIQVRDIGRIAKTMDDSDVPSEERMMVVTTVGWRRLLWLQAPWWRKLISKICPWLLTHDWTTNSDPEGMEMRDGRMFNYLVCNKCGDVTDLFDIGSKEEFAKWYRNTGGCLGVRHGRS